MATLNTESRRYRKNALVCALALVLDVAVLASLWQDDAALVRFPLLAAAALATVGTTTFLLLARRMGRTRLP
jgi:hypothetical protein